MGLLGSSSAGAKSGKPQVRGALGAIPHPKIIRGMLELCGPQAARSWPSLPLEQERDGEPEEVSRCGTENQGLLIGFSEHNPNLESHQINSRCQLLLGVVVGQA